MAENMPPAPGKALTINKDIRPLVDEIDSLIAKADEAGGSLPPEMRKEMPAEGGDEGMTEAGDVQVIADTLGVSIEKAQALFDAAQQMPRLAGKSATDIAMMLEKDMTLRMQLEKSMGAGEDMKAREDMAKMPAPPPMEPTPGPMK
jgi:hypothetical protein